MTIAEEIKRKWPTISKEEVRNYICEAIIKTFEDYPERVVGFRILEYNISKPFISVNANSPFPQVIVSIYIPEILDITELNRWLVEEGLKWDMLGGEYAWRLV